MGTGTCVKLKEPTEFKRRVLSRIMYELEVCSDGTTEAQPRSFRQNRPTASTLSDIMQVQHMSRKIRENAETFPYLAKL